MKKLIIAILKEIELDKEYIKLCQRYCDFDRCINLSKKVVEPYIKSYDPDFKYVSKDRVFMKESLYQGYTVRFFVSYRQGVIGFSYLIWKEGENHIYYKGNLSSLTKELDSNFEEKVKYTSPITTSLDDFEKILSKIFMLYNDFLKKFKESTKDSSISF